MFLIVKKVMPMITTQDLMKKYNISRQTVNNWIKQEKIPSPLNKKGHQNAWNYEQLELLDSNFNNETTKSLLKINNRRYLGSKQRMLPFIEKVVDDNTCNIHTVADIFGGTGVVANLFKEKGKNIIVNDILTSNYVSYQTWFSSSKIDENKIKNKLFELNHLSGVSGYVTKNFGNRYFSIDNAKKIDAIREQIEQYSDINFREKSILLTSLLYAMDKVANTVGHFDAFRKKMDNLTPIYLKLPELTDNKDNKIYNTDANELVKKIKADLVYIDTPYNSRGYENAYHVLENVIEWKKPAVEGIAKKAINRKEKSSEYTKARAPQAFADLISHINAKYILVSYNNMAKKGNSRSNAKISNEEIIQILKTRGKVQVFDTDFSAFTTGKTNIKDHKELLYLCTVNTRQPKIVKSALNYTGSKHKLLPQLLPLFPSKCNTFIDLFCGGASVTVNLANLNIAKSYIANDIESHVIEFFNYLSKSDPQSFIQELDNKISYYGLSNTYKYGYNHYNCNSSQGLSKYNQDKFLTLRKDYNNSPSPLLFYLLIVFGFNNQIRFNKRNHYNLPVGKRDFNKNMRNKLTTFSNIIRENNITFSNHDFRDISFKAGDFIYADPPYLISNATYNENNGWTKDDELSLYAFLDLVDKKKAKFALSNVLVHKGKENDLLKKWAKKYHLHVLNYDYNNSNYHSTAKHNNTVEVLITNY